MADERIEKVQDQVQNALNGLKVPELHFPQPAPELKDAIYHLEQAYMALGVYKESQGATV